MYVQAGGGEIGSLPRLQRLEVAAHSWDLHGKLPRPYCLSQTGWFCSPATGYPPQTAPCPPVALGVRLGMDGEASKAGCYDLRCVAGGGGGGRGWGGHARQRAPLQPLHSGDERGDILPKSFIGLLPAER